MFRQELQYLICMLEKNEIKPRIAVQVSKAQKILEKGLPNGTIVCLPWKKLDPKQNVAMVQRHEHQTAIIPLLELVWYFYCTSYKCTVQRREHILSSRPAEAQPTVIMMRQSSLHSRFDATMMRKSTQFTVSFLRHISDADQK